MDYDVRKMPKSVNLKTDPPRRSRDLFYIRNSMVYAWPLFIGEQVLLLAQIPTIFRYIEHQITSVWHLLQCNINIPACTLFSTFLIQRLKRLRDKPCWVLGLTKTHRLAELKYTVTDRSFPGALLRAGTGEIPAWVRRVRVHREPMCVWGDQRCVFLEIIKVPQYAIRIYFESHLCSRFTANCKFAFGRLWCVTPQTNIGPVHTPWFECSIATFRSPFTVGWNMFGHAARLTVTHA